MHRRVDGRHVEVTVDGDGGDNRPFHIQIEQVQSGVRGPRKSRQLLVLARPRAGGAWGAWGRGGAAGRWNFSQAHSKDARSAVRGARACKTFLPVRSPLWHAVSRRQRSTLGSRSPCVRTARSHLPHILNRERTDCPSAEARSRRSPLCGGREPICLHVRRPRLPRGINRVEQEAEKWM